MAAIGLVPAGAHRNRDYYFSRVSGLQHADQAHLDLLSDPQTSGGLLIAVASDRKELLQRQLTGAGVAAFSVGEAVSGPAGRLELIE